MNEFVQPDRWDPQSYSRDELVGILDEALSGEDSAE
jgi:hypothetical protein